MKTLFLPYCARKKDICSEDYNGNILNCKIHEGCDIGELKSFAERRNWRVYVIRSSKNEGGNSTVEEIIKKEKPELFVGSACIREINKIKERYYGNPFIAISLLKEGCNGSEIGKECIKGVINALDNKI